MSLVREKTAVKKIMDVISIPNTTKFGDVFTWAELSELHRVRNGIYHRDGRLVSLLTDFGRINPCYPDFHGRSTDEIHYTGFGRRGDQKLNASNQALVNAIESGHSVPLFNKLSPGKWEYQGMWQVVASEYVFDEKQNRMLWKFTLVRHE
jgi:hypothetical protein